MQIVRVNVFFFKSLDTKKFNVASWMKQERNEYKSDVAWRKGREEMKECEQQQTFKLD